MATVYLSTTGSDSYTYAQAQNPATPWASFSKVNTSAVAGDTVSVGAGTYTWSTIAWSKNLTFVGTSVSSCILDAGGAAIYWDLAQNITLNLQNLTFQNASTSAAAYKMLFNLNNISGTENTQFSFTSCIIRNITLVATALFRISLFGATTNNGQEQARVYLDKCLIYNINRSATTYGDPLLLHYTGTCYGCVISITGSTIIINGTNSPDRLIYYPSSGSPNTLIFKNSIIFNGTGSTFNFYGTGSATDMTESVTYSDFYLVTTTGLTTGTGYITSDPLLVDVANANFNLRPASPCIDAGTNL